MVSSRKRNGELPRLFEELTPIDSRHPVIAYDQVRLFVNNFEQSIGAIGRRVCVAVLREAPHEQVEDQSVIIHDQHFDFFPRRHLYSRFSGRT